jgi:dihydrofolate synthase/folylpolyglutamate synthase
VTESVHAAARALNCRTLTLGREITVKRLDDVWNYDCDTLGQHFPGIALGALAPVNCALALTAAILILERLEQSAPPDPGVLARAFLPGRLECHTHAGRAVVLDVAHNPAAARFLARELDARWPGRRYVALYGALEDKDAAGVVKALGNRVSHWLLISTHGWRAQTAQALAERLSPVAAAAPLVFDEVRSALDRAVSLSGPGNGILGFGSFSAVEQVRELLIVPPSQGD